MPEYLAPGVYVEEVDTGARPIEGVSTSTAGMVGMTQKGPVDGVPVLVTSFADFQRKFGGYLGKELGNSRYLAYAVEGFFQNGGERVYIKRVPGKDSPTSVPPIMFVEAEQTVKGGMVTKLADDTIVHVDTDSDGTDDASEVKLESLRGISNLMQLTFTQIIDGVKTEETVNVFSYDSDKKKVTVSPKLNIVYQKKYTHVTVNVDGGTRSNTIKIKAKNQGTWGNNIKIQVKHTSKGKSTVASHIGTGPDYSQIELNSINYFKKDDVIEIDNGTDRSYNTITAVSGKVVTLSVPVNATASPVGAKVSTCEFDLVVSYKDQQEVFDFLNMSSGSDNYFETVIEDKSELITVEKLATTNNAPFDQPSADDGLLVALEDGGDGDVPDPSAYIGVDAGPGLRTGIKALVDIDQVSIVAVPGEVRPSVLNAMIIHCETLKDRFAILDPPSDQDIEQIQNFRSDYDTKYAAIYYPWITIRDSLTDKKENIPPSGHIAGIYARSDNERGVHKAPANEVIKGITGLEQTINKGEQDILNPKPNHINVLRDFRKSRRGYRVWGARCITSDPDWKYINVRRLFIFVEESIEEGTQWVVFEPNDEPTWARVRRSVSNFLTNVWRDGALQGSKPDKAFFVRCDRTTMTQTDIDNGKLIMLIGIAPVKPAEFVIFRIGQWAGGSEVEEF